MARTLIRLLALLALLAPCLALAQAPRPGPTVRTVTAASDTVLNTDCGNIVQYNRATAVAATLPAAGDAGNFNARCQITLVNIGAGNVTIGTSAIDGRSNLVLQQGGGVVATSTGAAWASTGIFPALSTSGIVDSDQLPTATDTVKGGIIAGTCITMGGAGNKTASVSTSCRQRPYTFAFGDGSTVTATGKLGIVVIKNACTIAAWAIELISFDTGTTSTTTFDIWVSSSAIPTVSNTIMGTKPTVSAGRDTGAVTTGISGWTSAGAITAGSRLVVNLDANDHATLGTFMFWCAEG